jgi:hypothetical protein
MSSTTAPAAPTRTAARPSRRTKPGFWLRCVATTITLLGCAGPPQALPEDGATANAAHAPSAVTPWSGAERTLFVELSGDPARLDGLEYALAALPRLVPQREDRAVSPGLARPLQFGARGARATLLEGDESNVVRLEICPSPSDCVVLGGQDVGELAQTAGAMLLPDLSWGEPAPPPAAETVARWLEGREAAAEGAWTRAEQIFAEVAELDPEGIGAADRAAALAVRGDERALEAWRSVDALRPRDPRFVLPIAIVEGRAGELDALERRLSALPAAARRGDDVLAARAEVDRPEAEGPDGPGAPLDGIGAARRRPRSPPPARRDPLVLVAQGRIALEAGDAEEALRLAERVLRRRRWHPEGLALQVDALEQLGRPADASRARQKLRWAEPGR